MQATWKGLVDMVENSSITPEIAISELENLIGITRHADFSAPPVNHNIFEQVHQDMLLITFAEEALNQIKTQLGYLPRREATLPDEPAVQQLIYDYYFKRSDIDILFDSCNPILDKIYAREMQPHQIEDYSKEIYRLYDTLYMQYAPAARLRVTQLLGHEPELKNSVYAEILLRCRMAELGFTVWEGRIAADYEAEAIIWYRENLLIGS